MNKPLREKGFLELAGMLLSTVGNFVKTYKNTAMFLLVTKVFELAYISTIGNVSMIPESFQTNVLVLIVIMNAVGLITVASIESKFVRQATLKAQRDKELKDDEYFEELAKDFE